MSTAAHFMAAFLVDDVTLNHSQSHFILGVAWTLTGFPVNFPHVLLESKLIMCVGNTEK